MDQQQQTATKPKVLTKTNIAVMLSVGMIAAFFVGLNMLFFMDYVVRDIARPFKPEPIVTQNYAKTLKNINFATIQVDPTTMHDTDELLLAYIQGNDGTTSLDFGQYYFNPPTDNHFVDLHSSEESMPLAVQLSAGTHPAMLVTIQIGDDTTSNQELDNNEENYLKEGWNLLSSALKINEANAQIHINETFSICIPEKSTTGDMGYSTKSNSKFGFKVADALVVDPEQYRTTYYVDIDGNTYFDAELTQRANTEDCNQYTSRALNFNDYLGGLMTPEVPAEELNFTLAKGWDQMLVLAGYGAVEGLVDLYNDELGVQSPLFIIGNAGSGAEGSFLIEPFILTMNTDEGIKKLCIPETLDDDSYFVYFFDNNGTPYHDMFLTNMASEESCANLQTNAYTPDILYGGTFNTPFNIDDIAFQNLQVAFIRDNNILANVKTSTGDYNNGYVDTYPIYDNPNEADPESYSPLSIYIGSDDNADQIYLAENTVTLGADDEENPEQTTLCVPATTIPSHNDTTVDYAPVVYYYDIEGTPYYDPLLQSPVMDSGCDELLANAYTPDILYGGAFETPFNIDDITFQNLQVVFLRDNIPLANVQTGIGNENNGYVDTYPSYDNPNWDHTDSRAPMYIQFGSDDNSDQIYLESNTVTIGADDEQNPEQTTLCVPATTIPSHNDTTVDYAPVRYFYDADGTPYSDRLLTDKVSCGSADNPNNCGWVTDGYCDKYPNNTCCAQAASQNIAL